MEYCPHDGKPLLPPEPSDTWDSKKLVSFDAPAYHQCTVGDKLGPYKLVSILGEGGMGTVFEGEHELLNRRVAIKVLLPEFSDQQDILRRFFKEARAVNQIQHSSIIEITDFVEAADHPPYMVMELLKGGDLADHIDRHAPLSVEETIQIALQICDALAAVHKRDIVHRDLKPDNIVVEKEVEKEGTDHLKIKLLDFGIAKFLVTDETFLMTRTGEIIGTPEYMAPEQVRGMKVDERVDIYAVGIMLYEMLTGRRPFEGNLKLLLHAQISKTPQKPSARLGAGQGPIPAWLDDLIMTCLAKDPADRPQTMDDLLAVLRRHVRGETPNSETVNVPSFEKTVFRPPRWMWVAGAGVLAAAAVAVGLWASGVFSPAGSPNEQATHARNGEQKRLSRSGQPPGSASAKAIRLQSHPSGAAVFDTADGRFVGKTPQVIHLGPGQRKRYRFRMPGHLERETTIGHRSDSPVVVSLLPRKKAPRRKTAARIADDTTAHTAAGTAAGTTAGTTTRPPFSRRQDTGGKSRRAARRRPGLRRHTGRRASQRARRPARRPVRTDDTTIDTATVNPFSGG
jgi:serine/threonine-protein kinase